jgi:hypothetical protein
MSTEQNALALLGGQSGPVSRYDDDVINDLVIQGGFLPRLGLYTSRSKLVQKELFKANHWGVVTGKDKLQDLGEEVVCVPLAYRPMALDLREKKAVAHFDPNSPKFKECKEESTKKDSKCMAGVQFLVYIQNFGFATYYCASKSAKMLAPHIRKLLNNFVKLSSHTVESGDFVYRAPTVVISNVQFELGDVQALIAKRNEFVNVGPTQVTDKDLEGVGEEAGATAPVGGTEARPR